MTLAAGGARPRARRPGRGPGLTRALAFVAALAAPAPGLALSCEPWTEIQAFRWAAQAEGSYVVAVGRFAFDAGLMPLGEEDAPDETLVPARFSGHSLTRAGFTSPLEARVTLRVRCAVAWCGHIEPAAPYMAFIKRQTGRYVLAVDLCPAAFIANPTREMKSAVTACLRGEGCER